MVEFWWAGVRFEGLRMPGKINAEVLRPSNTVRHSVLLRGRRRVNLQPHEVQHLRAPDGVCQSATLLSRGSVSSQVFILLLIVILHGSYIIVPIDYRQME